MERSAPGALAMMVCEERRLFLWLCVISLALTCVHFPLIFRNPHALRFRFGFSLLAFVALSFLL